jgi:multiple antibiotic resistance protein
MHPQLELFIGFFVQLLVIVDPVAGVPLFLAITPGSTIEERRSMARRGCVLALLILGFFLLFGPALLAYFGIGLAAVRICGGILLFAIALEMLSGRPTRTISSRRERELAGAKEDISLTPLAFPLLAGPGAIATTLLFAPRAVGIGDRLLLLAAAALVLLVTLLMLRRAEGLLRLIGDLGATIVTRLMGLILAFLAVQYVIDGVRGALGTGP